MILSFKNFYDFFFDYNISSHTAAGLRIAVYSFYLIHWAYRFKDFFLFSKPDGFYPTKSWKEYRVYRQIIPYLYGIKFLENSTFYHKCLYFGLFFFGLCSAIGLLTNISSFLFFLCFITLSMRIMFINGCAGDLFAKVMTFSLIFVDTGSVWSLDSLLGISSNLKIVDAWSFRLVQLHLITCYIYSAYHKLEDYSWSKGNAFKQSVFSKNWCRIDQWFFPNFLREPYISFFQNRLVGKLGNLATVFGEFFTGFFYLFSETRYLAMSMAIMFHLGTIVFLRLGHFGGTLILANLFYLK